MMALLLFSTKKNRFMQPFFYVRIDKRYEQINFNDIIYIKGKKGYIQIVTEQRTFLIMNTLASVVNYLPPDQFARIHHSYIVSLSRMKAFDRLCVWLHDMPEDKPYRPGLARVKELPVGFAYRGKLRQAVSFMLNKSGSYHRKLKHVAAELALEENEIDL
jgi:hypothetical protein